MSRRNGVLRKNSCAAKILASSRRTMGGRSQTDASGTSSDGKLSLPEGDVGERGPPPGLPPLPIPPPPPAPLGELLLLLCAAGGAPVRLSVANAVLASSYPTSVKNSKSAHRQRFRQTACTKNSISRRRRSIKLGSLAPNTRFSGIGGSGGSGFIDTSRLKTG